jgi:hypothetical protein
MSDWEIRIPYRTRSDSLVDVATEARAPDPDDREVVRQLVLDAAGAGMRKVGELLDDLEHFSPAERRVLLDQARRRAGLATTGEAEEDARFERANQAARIQASLNSAWQVCNAADCTAIPMNELGVPVETSVRKWFCPAHVHLAAEGDMEPRSSGIRIAESGALLEIDEAEEARVAAKAESRRR